MKDTWLKVLAIVMAVALLFTIVTSNVVSITAIFALRAAKNGSSTVIADTTAAATNADVTSSGDTQAVDTSTGTDTASDTQTSGTTSSGGSTTTTKSSGTVATTSSSSKVPTTKAEILAFYKAACDKITKNAAAGYSKKEWQELKEFDVGNGAANTLVKSLANNYMTTEDEVEEQVQTKGSKEAKSRFPACTMTDANKYLQSATCTASGNNYVIKMVVVDDDTPKKTKNVLGQITNSVLYWEDIKEELDNISQVKSVDESKTHVYYNDFTITCTITKDGKFVAMRHFATVDITAVAVLEIVFDFDLNAQAQLLNTCDYYSFKY